MTESYRTKPDPFGPLPAYGCPHHQIRTYGVLKDGHLVAYMWLYQVGDMCRFSTILGHGEHLNAGVSAARTARPIAPDARSACGSMPSPRSASRYSISTSTRVQPSGVATAPRACLAASTTTVAAARIWADSASIAAASARRWRAMMAGADSGPRTGKQLVAAGPAVAVAPASRSA